MLTQQIYATGTMKTEDQLLIFEFILKGVLMLKKSVGKNYVHEGFDLSTFYSV